MRMSGLTTASTANGKRLAFYRMDQSMVTDYPQVNTFSQPIATFEPDKYPMAGEESEDVSVAVYDVKSKKTVWLKNPKPMTDYMTNISWAPDGSKLYVFELNRDQNHMQLFGYDPVTGEKDAQPIVEEKHPKSLPISGAADPDAQGRFQGAVVLLIEGDPPPEHIQTAFKIGLCLRGGEHVVPDLAVEAGFVL